MNLAAIRLMQENGGSFVRMLATTYHTRRDEMSKSIATQILTSRPSLHDISLILEAVERACEQHGRDGADIAWYIGHALDEAKHSIRLEEAGERDSMWPGRGAA